MHKIIWTEKTLNLSTGCTPCSPGCNNCYARRMAKRLHAMGNEKYRNEFEYTEHPEEFEKFKLKKSGKIFVNSMSDTFHEKATVKHLEKTLELFERNRQHTFQVLTKRPQNIPAWFKFGDNVHLGLTICNQQEYNEKMPVFVLVESKYKFLSIEPLLSSIEIDYLANKVGLVIVGGESGPRSRSIRPEWIRTIRNYCAQSGTPFLFKQWGDNPGIGVDKINSILSGYRDDLTKGGRILEGKIHDGTVL